MRRDTTSGASVTAVLPASPAGTHFATRRIDEARRHMDAEFGVHELGYATRSRELAMRHLRYTSTSLSFHRLRYGGRVRMHTAVMEQFFMFQVNVTGRCRVSQGTALQEVRPGDGYVVDPALPLAKEWEPDCEQLIIRVSRCALDRFLRSELPAGADPVPMLRFDNAVTRDVSVRLLPVIRALHEQLESMRRYAIHARATAHLEDALLAVLLDVFPNNLAPDLQGRPYCAPYYVKRALDAMCGPDIGALSVLDLTQAAGVSERTLYYGFRKFVGTTPAAYLKGQRLALAHARLRAATPGQTTVAAVARACGFGHPGRFARDFRQRYGEAPSALLRR